MAPNPGDLPGATLTPVGDLFGSGGADPFAASESYSDAMLKAIQQYAPTDETYQTQQTNLNRIYAQDAAIRQQALDNALANLYGMRDAASGSIGMAYDAGRNASLQGASQDLAIGAAQGADMAAIYQAAQDAIAARNAGIAGGVNSALGVAAPTGASLDTAGLMAAAGPREQALANALGQIGANEQNYMASSMGAQSAAANADMQRLVASRAADLIQANNQAAANAAHELAMQRLGLSSSNDARNFELAKMQIDAAAFPAQIQEQLALSGYNAKQKTISDITAAAIENGLSNGTVSYDPASGSLVRSATFLMGALPPEASMFSVETMPGTVGLMHQMQISPMTHTEIMQAANTILSDPNSSDYLALRKLQSDVGYPFTDPHELALYLEGMATSGNG